VIASIGNRQLDVVRHSGVDRDIYRQHHRHAVHFGIQRRGRRKLEVVVDEKLWIRDRNRRVPRISIIHGVDRHRRIRSRQQSRIRSIHEKPEYVVEKSHFLVVFIRGEHVLEIYRVAHRHEIKFQIRGIHRGRGIRRQQRLQVRIARESVIARNPRLAVGPHHVRQAPRAQNHATIESDDVLPARKSPRRLRRAVVGHIADRYAGSSQGLRDARRGDSIIRKVSHRKPAGIRAIANEFDEAESPGPVVFEKYDPAVYAAAVGVHFTDLRGRKCREHRTRLPRRQRLIYAVIGLCVTRSLNQGR